MESLGWTMVFCPFSLISFMLLTGGLPSLYSIFSTVSGIKRKNRIPMTVIMRKTIIAIKYGLAFLSSYSIIQQVLGEEFLALFHRESHLDLEWLLYYINRY